MKLTVIDRLACINLLPQRGDYITLKLADGIRKKVEFSLEEAQTINLKMTEAGASWDKEIDFTIDLSETECALLVRELKRLDDERQLSQDHLGLYEKLI